MDRVAIRHTSALCVSGYAEAGNGYIGPDFRLESRGSTTTRSSPSEAASRARTIDASSAVPGPTELLVRAEAAYQAAVADPATAGPVAEAVAAEARRAGDVEAEVVALRAQAWCAVRAELAEQRARRLLNRAAQLAEAAGLDERLSEVL